MKRKPKAKKIVPYVVGAFFLSTLYFTQFFNLFYDNQKQAYDKHVDQNTLLSSIFDFSNPGDFVDLISNLQKYATELMTSIDVTQMYSFLNDGLSFIRMETVGNQVNAESNNSNKDYQYKYKSESANLTIENKPTLDMTDPLVYIFNTHTSEAYEGEKVNDSLGRKVTVVDTSKQISSALDQYGIKSVVEMRDVGDVLAANNWNYYRSYEGARLYLEDMAQDYSSLKYFVDIHRDALPYDRTTATINGKKYAQVLFVVGEDHARYKENLQFTKDIIELMNKKYPGLAKGKGYITKGGEYVNGIYNQDFATTVLLIECGGEDNTYEEISNTAAVIAEVLYEYISQNE